jgi:tetratricopeptide (TPR) repeat protein
MSLQAQLDTALAQLQQGRVDEAIRLYTQILGGDRHQPDALYMLGAISYRLGGMEQALEFAEAVTMHAPQQARGWALKGMALRNLHRAEEALIASRRAIALDPDLAEAWECAGTALMQYGQWPEARAHFEQALKRFPAHANLRGSYALVLNEEGDLKSAHRACEAALTIDPSCASALLAKITVLANAGYYDLALSCARAAAEQSSVKKPFLFARGALALLTGQFDEGYELLAADRPAHGPAASLPDWRGEGNRHVMLFGEQGYGDTLQFVRFAGRAAQKAGRLTARVPNQLERLLRFSMPDLNLSVYQPLTTHARRPMHEIDPVFDFPPEVNARCSFLALPHALQLGADAGADRVPYLRADPVLTKTWRERLAAILHPRVALVWAGSPQHGNDHNRSLAFDTIKPLAEKFRAHLVSMQVGPGTGEATRAGIFDAAPLIADFADSAALLDNVDLLITVDTAPAHLAGGMGKPVWLMLPFDPDWRWFVAREDSPWYPSMRLYRQPQPKDWPGVVQKLSADLERLIAGDRSVLEPKRGTGGFLDRHPLAMALDLDGA